MAIDWILVIAVFLIGGISSYTTTVASRGADGPDAVLNQGAVRGILNGLNLLAIIATAVWGFINLEWYLVLIALVGAMFSVGIIYGGRAMFGFWYVAQPVLDILCVGGATYLWFSG